VGRTDQSEDEVAENIEYVANTCIRYAVKSSDLVQSLNIKTPNSISLPIFCQEPPNEIAHLLERDSDNTNRNHNNDVDDNNEGEITPPL
jgi:hypothetical protein